MFQRLILMQSKRSGLLSLFFLMVSFCLLLAACGSGKLTRQKAAEHIEKSKKLTKEMDYIYLNSRAPKKGVKLEIWKRFSNKFKLSEKGKKYFSAVGDTFFFSGSYRAKLVTPTEINVEVTGIVDAPKEYGGKQVNFVWSYLNLPSVVKRFAVKGGEGKAHFKKYDDGWRIEKLEYKYSKDPAELTDRELAEEKKEISKIAEAKKKEADRLKKLVEKSKKQRKILGNFVLVDDHDKNYIVTTEITISDVDFTYLSTTKTKTRQWVNGKETTIWFGHVKNLKRKSHKLKNNKFVQYGTSMSLPRKRGNVQGCGWFSTNEKEFDKCHDTLSSAVAKWRVKYDEIVKRKLY